MSAPVVAPPGRGAGRVYAFLLDAGGWWAQHELVVALGLAGGASLWRQLHVLRGAGHIARRGAGTKGAPFEYGVTAACVPVPGVALQAGGTGAAH